MSIATNVCHTSQIFPQQKLNYVYVTQLSSATIMVRRLQKRLYYAFVISFVSKRTETVLSWTESLKSNLSNRVQLEPTFKLIFMIPVIMDTFENWTGAKISIRSENNLLITLIEWVDAGVYDDQLLTLRWCRDCVLRLESLLRSAFVPSSNSTPICIDQT